MSKSFKRSILLLIILGLTWFAYMPAFFRPDEPSRWERQGSSHQKTEPPSPALSMLAAPPDWSALQIYQDTITREEFEHLLTSVFTTGNAWQTCIEIDDTEARIKTGSSPTDEVFHLRFALTGHEVAAPRHWRTTAELPPAPPDKPLAGIKIAIDPGHIGGAWAKMEERWLVVDAGAPVCEGDMTLQVAKLLKPKLEALGASVSLVREKTEPVTPIRPEALLTLAREASRPEASPAEIQKTAERLFYRTAEIRARADLVNDTLKPDLVLCLHFNAEAWGDPNQPILTDHTHFHLVLNGAYNDEEVLLADQRVALLRKLLQRTHQEETLVGATIAATFAEISGLPPYAYPRDSDSVRPIAGQPYLWARNLLANRLYDCPVIFLEPYVMNSTIDYARIQAGDYEGVREIAGKPRPSIFREYSDALAASLAKYYALARENPVAPPAFIVAFHQEAAANNGSNCPDHFVLWLVPYKPILVMTPRFLVLLSALATTLSAQDGQQLFTLYCSACHGVDGKGATGGTFPPLAGSPWVMGDADRAVKIALKGFTGPVDVLGKTYNLEMPPQGAVLPDDQLAAILTYVRSAWGNQAAPVTADFVKTIRASVNDRNTPWTAEEILKLHPLPLEKTALTNLLSQAYSGKWSSMPDFSKLKAENVEEEHDGIISLEKAPFEDNFAILWQADFAAPADGEYQFLLDADDAAAVIIDGKTIAEVKGAGPMNGSRARQGKVTLTKGSHKFRVEFLELSDKQGIALGWRGPGEKGWKWLSDQNSKPAIVRDPIPIGPVAGRPVVYRNFIAGTSPRAIGIGFPGGLNLAYSADNLAPELLWTGAFIDGAAKWVERGTDNNPPAGENVVNLSKVRSLPSEARFRGYKLDPAGNPTFSVQIGDLFLLDSWHTESGVLIRKLTLTGNGSPLDLVISDHAVDDQLTLQSEGGELQKFSGKITVKLNPGKPATLTYRWKP